MKKWIAILCCLSFVGWTGALVCAIGYNKIAQNAVITAILIGVSILSVWIWLDHERKTYFDAGFKESRDRLAGIISGEKIPIKGEVYFKVVAITSFADGKRHSVFFSPGSDEEIAQVEFESLRQSKRV